jgi:tyrosine-specific transport protein
VILVVIAILLPIYLLYKVKVKQYHYSELSHKSLIIISAIVGVLIIGCEILNMMVG